MSVFPVPPTNPNDELPMQNITEQGTPPRHRLQDAAAAQDLVQRLLTANRERARFNAKIQGMLDGNPPFSAVTLRNAGQAYRCNVNFLEGKASLDAALTPYYDLFSAAKYYAEVKTDFGDDEQESDRWSRVITEEFDQMLRSYDQFDFNMVGMMHDRTAYGKGYLMWPDKKGWWFQHIPHHKVLVPDAAKASLSELEVLVVRESYQVHRLWAYIKDKEQAEKAGWNVQAVVNAIANAMPDDVSANTNDSSAYEYIQSFMKDKDICEGVRLSTVQAAHVFVREFDGKVSHLIVMENLTQYQDRNKIEPEYMFEDYACYDKFSHALAAFFFATLDGSWNGASALGRDIFSPMEIKNRLKCAAIDNSFLRSGITLQANDPEALTKTSLVQFGALNILPPGFSVQQATILGDVEGLLGMDNAIDAMLSSNTGVYKGRLEKPQGNPRTAEEVRLQYQNSATLGNSAVNRFYQELDWFYTEIYRRITMEDHKTTGEENEAVDKFYKECERRGVPIQAIKKVKYVRAFRNMGNGSLYMRQQAVLQTMQLVPMMTEGGRAAWLDEAISVTAGQDAADRWNPKRERKPTNQEWDAMIENGILKEGAPVVITPTQNNLIHAQIHIQAAAQAAASLKDGGDPMQVLGFLEMVGPHAGQHLQALSQDKMRKDEFKMLEKQWKDIARLTDQLRDQMKGAMEQRIQGQQQQQHVNLDKISISYKDLPETEKRQVEVALGLQPDGSPSASQDNMDLRKFQAQMRQQKQGQDMALKDVETAARLKQESQTNKSV